MANGSTEKSRIRTCFVLAVSSGLLPHSRKTAVAIIWRNSSVENKAKIISCSRVADKLKTLLCLSSSWALATQREAVFIIS